MGAINLVVINVNKRQDLKRKIALFGVGVGEKIQNLGEGEQNVMRKVLFSCD